jgi:hypothetical protein
MEIDVTYKQLPVLVYFENNKRINKTITFSPTGILMSIYLLGDDPTINNGTIICLHENRKLRKKIIYENNIEIKNDEYYESNGLVKKIGTLKNGKYDGIIIHQYESGNLYTDYYIDGFHERLDAEDIIIQTKNGLYDDFIAYKKGDKKVPNTPSNPSEGYPDHEQLYNQFKNAGIIMKLLIEFN